jgi:hypothetical protein
MNHNFDPGLLISSAALENKSWCQADVPEKRACNAMGNSTLLCGDATVPAQAFNDLSVIN